VNGTIARRNNQLYWVGTITWKKLPAKRRLPCEDCATNVRDHPEPYDLTHTIAPATWSRKSAVAETTLCNLHKKAWERWVPGQMDIGEVLR
jgi:hypothetical protein